MNSCTKIVMLGMLACSMSLYGSVTLQTSAAGLGANDSATFDALGPDGTTVANSFNLTTAANKNVAGTLTGNQGMLAVVGGSWSGASGDFTGNESLLWAYDNTAGVNAGSGPVSFSFPSVFGGGAAIQADDPGAFTASISVYDGGSLLASFTESSDANGDAIFIGALSTSADITRMVFDLTASSAGDIHDFAIGTLSFQNAPSTGAPEPGVGFLAGILASLMLCWRFGGKAQRSRKKAVAALGAMAVMCLCIPNTFGQTLKGTMTSLPAHSLPVSPNPSAGANTVSVGSHPLPMWTYSIKAYDGLNYTGTIIGVSPYNRGKTTTTVPTQVIPLIITIKDANGTITYDPTVADNSCVASGATPESLIVGSPIFTSNDYVMNGIDVGTTQYEDANVRAEFWSLVGGTPYHLMLQESSLTARSLSFGTGGTSGPGSNFTTGQLGTCDPIGVVQQSDMDTAVAALITGPLAGVVNTGTFPLFLTKNVVMTSGGTSLFNNCCILGYHSAFQAAGGSLQVYSPLEIDTTSAFGPGYTATMAHEIGEAIHDPSGVNPTPPWGNIGQQPQCQDNFEDGDPLSAGGLSPTNPFKVVSGSVTYELQELAFYDWFFGGTSLGAGGGYSGHGTLQGHAKACPPGGTN